MDLVPIKRSTIKKENKEIEVFIVPAIAMNTVEGKSRKVPHPHGYDNLVFKTLNNAIEAIDLAGFGYKLDDKLVPASDIPDRTSTDLSSALDPLLKMLKDTNQGAVASAAFALGELRNPKAIRPLIEIIGVDDNVIRKNAVEALAKMGDHAIKGLLEALDDDNWVARNSAAIALGELVKFSAGKVIYAVQPLIKRLDDSNWIVKSSAATSIGKISAYIREVSSN